MGLFDDKGNMNEHHAQRIYDQASGQVTGNFPAGIPILGEGIKFEDVEKADWPMVDQCIEHVRQPLEQGAPKEAPVVVALLQFAQLMRLLESFRPVPAQEGEKQEATLGDIFNALGEAISHVKRQEIHGKHEQDREDATAWLEKYSAQVEWLNSQPLSDLRLHLDRGEE